MSEVPQQRAEAAPQARRSRRGARSATPGRRGRTRRGPTSRRHPTPAFARVCGRCLTRRQRCATTHARALEAGLAWRPIEGSERARPPYELRPGTGRRGPDELWARFDAAVEQLNTAGAGDSLAEIVAAYAAVAHAAAALADALEAAGE